MCYFLYIASPLTLSEIRSMLSPGLTADLAPSSDQQKLKAIHPGAQTVARILAGRCSCDLVRRRLDDPRADERHLRERYRRLGLPRASVIAALERHRGGSAPRLHPATGWPKALAEFVIEHGRNAGSTLYLLVFVAGEGLASQSALPPPVARSLSEVRLDPDGWLLEGRPAVVS
jgi:hypothetical protein